MESINFNAAAKAVISRAKREAYALAKANPDNLIAVYDEEYNRLINLVDDRYNAALEFVNSLNNARHAQLMLPKLLSSFCDPSEYPALYQQQLGSHSMRVAYTFEYRITITCDGKKCSFDEFQAKVLQFVTRKCFVTHTLTFEHEPENGFSVCIVANTPMRSSSEAHFNLITSWKKWIKDGRVAADCMQIVNLRNKKLREE